METNKAFRADILKSRDLQLIIGKIKAAGYEVTPQEIFNAFKIDKNDVISDRKNRSGCLPKMFAENQPD